MSARLTKSILGSWRSLREEWLVAFELSFSGRSAVRRSIRTIVSGAGALAIGAALVALPASGTTVPGISKTQVNLGAIVTQSGLAAADFGAYIYGAEAYLRYVNDKGGIYGRKLVITNALDDQSSGSQDDSEAKTLVTSDHVFAVVGVSTAFFGGAAYLAKNGIPTFGYATQNVWAGPKNLFADYGSVLDYVSSVPDFAYVAKQVKATKIAIVALDYQTSINECKPNVSLLQKNYGKSAGIKVVYSNLAEPIFAANFTTDAIKMANDGVNMVISCMDAGNDVQLTKALQGQGIGSIPQVWVDGYDRSVLKKDAAYMSNVYFLLQHVPFEAAADYPSTFPGLTLYFNEMNKMGFSNYAYDDVAIMGWQSANLFAEGLKAAGANPTQAAVVAAINKIKNDVGGPAGLGVSAPTNWTVAHTKNTSPACVAFVHTQGTSGPNPSFALAFNHGSNPWVCFPISSTANINSPVSPPAGTPGA
jgi:ABC-type branched-subunit amino acid transport system substrate-binding protein